MLDEYLVMLEGERDHRKIGKSLNYLLFHKLLVKDCLCGCQKELLCERLENFLKKIQKKYEYQMVMTHILVENNCT